MSQLDAAIRATAAAPEDAGARLQLHEALAVAEVHLVLAAEAAQDRVVPLVVETGDGHVALVFEGEDRLAGFVDVPTPHLALSGRRLVAMFAGQGVGLLLNPGTEGAEILLPAEVVDWAASILGAALDAGGRRPVGFHAPGLTAAEMAALAARLGLMRGVIGAALVVGAGYADGSRAQMLALTGVAKAAEAAVAAALAETWRLRSSGGLPLDILFASSEAGLPDGLRAVARLVDLPLVPVPQAASPAPSRDPARPPKLR